MTAAIVFLEMLKSANIWSYSGFIEKQLKSLINYEIITRLFFCLQTKSLTDWFCQNISEKKLGYFPVT